MGINLNQISFSYTPQLQILSNFSLHVKAGDHITLQGPSGSGKSTLFRLLLGFEKPTTGKITINDQPLEGPVLQDFRNRTTWLPQDLDLGDGTLEEVFFFLFTFQNNKSNRPTQKQVEEIFQLLGLEDISWQIDFKSLSTGQRQRIGIALCYFLNKDILLLDEPTSALDQTSKEKVKKLLFNPNTTIISASHDPWWIKQSQKTIKIGQH